MKTSHYLQNHPPIFLILNGAHPPRLTIKWEMVPTSSSSLSSRSFMTMFLLLHHKSVYFQSLEKNPCWLIMKRTSWLGNFVACRASLARPALAVCLVNGIAVACQACTKIELKIHPDMITIWTDNCKTESPLILHKTDVNRRPPIFAIVIAWPCPSGCYRNNKEL